jgi:hypothetical protein
LKRLIAKKFQTVLIDEYNTSKKCCHCWTNLEKVNIGEKRCFRLLGCKRCVEQKDRKIGSQEDEPKPNLSSYKLLTRDKNSCQNMLRITRYMMNNKRKRPKNFSRSQKEE